MTNEWFYAVSDRQESLCRKAGVPMRFSSDGCEIPAWAMWIYGSLPQGEALEVATLRRAARDEQFRRACITIANLGSHCLDAYAREVLGLR